MKQSIGGVLLVICAVLVLITSCSTYYTVDQDIQFSQIYEQAVEQRMQAIVKQQQAEADKAKAIIDADAKAYAVKAAADATAHQIEVQGQAQAAANQERLYPLLVSGLAQPPWPATKN